MIVALLVAVIWFFQRELFNEITSGLRMPASLAGIGLIIGLAPIAFRVLYHRYTHSYEIEGNQKLRITAGFIARHKREFTLSDKVQTDVSQSIIARLLNFGTIAFWTGDDRSRLEWRNAPDPDRIVAFLDHVKKSADVDQKPQFEDAPQHNNVAPAPRRSIEVPTLKEAKSTHATHFGRGSEAFFKPSAEMIAKRIQTPFGAYTDNDDGTVSDHQNRLMFIRAPWGMVWNGDRFVGEPIALNWGEAVRQFGRGVDVGYKVGGTMAQMGEEKRNAAAFKNGYESGRCQIEFAGFTDWRLPTADEFDRMSPYCHRFESGVSGADTALTPDEQSDWGWRGPFSRAVFERLYPEFSAMHEHAWTATGLGGGLAWAFDGGLPVGDFKVQETRPVIFVRNIRHTDIPAATTVDEKIPSAS